MLRVTIDLLPYGSERNKETLETIDIINVGKSYDLSYYDIISLTKDTESHVDTTHNRDHGYRPLVLKAIAELIGLDEDD